MQYNVVGFAKEELEKYLSVLGIDAEITLCLFDEIGISDEKVKDPIYDDAFDISVINGKGHIAGSNERSVLIGAYRFLSELGIKWIRPGDKGAYIPKNGKMVDVKLHEAADRRHRTVCIEGAVTLQNVLDMVDWLPKVGFNGYQIQHKDAFLFFNRWYSNMDNPLKELDESFTHDKAAEYCETVIKEIKKRGILLQRMGHGWTCDPYGVPSHKWFPKEDDPLYLSYIKKCALVNGKRDVYLNTPNATQLCYSDPEVKKTMVDSVINYMLDNKDTDIVHFWLGDSPNNTCECENCTKEALSDFYVKMVNEITDRMNELGLKNKIVLIIYLNTVFPPEVERIKSTDRTILMFAPISRTFGAAYPDGFKVKSIPRYKTNGFDFPSSVDENLAYLYAWEKNYDGDVVDFDYHLMWDHILDAGGECIARVLNQDAKNLENLGMNGFISCQLNRNAFPTSIAMTTLARTLWNKETDFEIVKRELYASTYGEDCADIFCKYFATLSRAFDIGAIRSQVKADPEVMKENMRAAIKAMEDIESLISSHLDIEAEAQRESYEILALHRQIYLTLGRGILLMLEGDEESGDKLREESISIAWRNEEKLQKVLDCMFYQNMTRKRINLDGAKTFFD